MIDWWWYQTYLLQLENYNLARYFRVLFKRGWYPLGGFESRMPLQKTFKLNLIIWLALGGGLFSSFIFYNSYYYLSGLFLAYLFLWPVLLALATVFVAPLDLAARAWIMGRAYRKLKLGKLKIIAVVGSYGKTTTKEAIAAALSSKKVLFTQDNFNTPLGIGRLILKSDLATFDFFVAEIGEYYPGDIAKLIKFLSPSVVIITGINEAHLERFGTLAVTTRSIFEGVTAAPESANIFLNADDDLISQNYEKFCTGRKIEWYGFKALDAKYRIREVKFDSDRGGYSFEIVSRSNQVFKARTELLGGYVLSLFTLGLQLACLFKVSEENALHGLKNLVPVKHRLELIKGKNGILVIDDSYNGTPTGVKAALATLNNFVGRRKIILTPGLVEVGDANERVHKDLGREMAKVANLVILIKNSATPFIAAGLAEAGFAKNQIVWFNTAQLAHQNLDKILIADDVILFQNDWGDNYV